MHFLDKNAIMLFHVTVPAQLGDKRIGDEVFVGTSIHFGPEGDLHSTLFAGNERHDCRVTGTLNNQGEMRIRDMPDQDTLGRSQGKNLTNRMPWLHMMGGDRKSEENVIDRRSELVHDVPDIFVGASRRLGFVGRLFVVIGILR